MHLCHGGEGESIEAFLRTELFGALLGFLRADKLVDIVMGATHVATHVATQVAGEVSDDQAFRGEISTHLLLRRVLCVLAAAVVPVACSSSNKTSSSSPTTSASQSTSQRRRVRQPRVDGFGSGGSDRVADRDRRCL